MQLSFDYLKHTTNQSRAIQSVGHVCSAFGHTIQLQSAVNAVQSNSRSCSTTASTYAHAGISRSVNLFVSLSVNRPVCLSTGLSARQFVCRQSVRCQSVCRQSITPLFIQSVSQSVCQSISLSVCLSVTLPVSRSRLSVAESVCLLARHQSVGQYVTACHGLSRPATDCHDLPRTATLRYSLSPNVTRPFLSRTFSPNLSRSFTRTK